MRFEWDYALCTLLYTSNYGGSGIIFLKLSYDSKSDIAYGVCGINTPLSSDIKATHSFKNFNQFTTSK